MRSMVTANGLATSGDLDSFFRSLADEASPMSDPRIIDLTAEAVKSQRKGMRDPKKVNTLVLHQMACCFKVRDPLKRFLNHFAPHFAILADGRILQLHPIPALTWASNDFNSNSVAVEFAGNFPNTRGKWWLDKNELKKLNPSQAQAYVRANQNQLTPAQIEAGHYLVNYLISTMGLKRIVAHRQSSNMRENDPGPDIWYHVGQWAIDNLGLTDGGPGFKVGTGNSIPDVWRTWGKVQPQREQEFSQSEYEEGEVHIQPVENRGRRNLERGILVRRTSSARLACGDPRDLILAPTISAEGGYDSVNIYDRGILSWGIMQSAAHAGGLQSLIGFIKQKDPDAFQRHFGRVGLDVANGQFVFQGNVVPIGPNSTQLRLLFRGSADIGAYDDQVIRQWATIFALAGRDPAVQDLQRQYARQTVDSTLNRKHPLLGRRSPRELLGNDLGALATFFSLRINNPRQAYLDLQRAVTQAGGAAGASQIAAAFARAVNSSSFNDGAWSRRASAVPGILNRARAAAGC